VSWGLSRWQPHASPGRRAPNQCAQVLCRVNARCRSMPRLPAPARPGVSLRADAVAPSACFTQHPPSVTRLSETSAIRGAVSTVPNPAFERTAASALRLLAVPSSLRSSAAAQRDRSASRMATLIRTQDPPALCSSPRQPLVPDSLSRRRLCTACHHRPAHAGARAADALCPIQARPSRRRALNLHRRFSAAARSVPWQTPLVQVMPGSVLSSTLAHTKFAVLASARAVPAATPNHAFDRTAASVPLAVPSSLRSSAAGQRGR
jgi:hypothetical protein